MIRDPSYPLTTLTTLIKRPLDVTLKKHTFLLFTAVVP